jgi:amino acid adenylation domain-containing protein
VHVTCRPLAESDITSGGGSVIGRALPDLRLLILSPELAHQAIGVPGELCVGGAGLARGYLGLPERTAERFVPDPWGGEPGGRLYRSGDLGRWLGDGDVQYLGRLDHQVKVRGFRIELGEIEAALATCPQVRGCAVLARQDEPGDTRLVAYVVAVAAATSTGRIGEAALREHLKRFLPEHMVPSAYLFLDALPLTENGKLDRAALPEPGKGGGGEEYSAPGNPVEEILAGIWQEVLGRERVGVRDDFFGLGGHSLLATQVISRVREVFQVELPVRQLFESPTIETFARGVEEALQGSQRVDLPPIVAVARDADLPLSFAQERLWFIDQLEPGNPAYNVPWAVELRGELDLLSLRRTFCEVVRRHEVLRTTFEARGQGAVQRIAPSGPLPLPVVALAGLPEVARWAEVLRLGRAEARRRFDLRSGPLLRAVVLGVEERRNVLLLTVHHIVSDGWSVGLLVAEMSALYPAFQRGEPSPLPELPIQYADFAVWQRGWLAGEVLAAQLAYWREQLGGVPRRLEFPTDRPRPPWPSHRGRRLPVVLSADLSRHLAAWGRREKATPFMILLAGFGALLGRWTGQDQVRLGTPIANRNRQETEALIGFFVNTLVMPVDLAGSPGFRGLVGRVRQASLGAYTHQDLPFERLVDELAPERDPRQMPLFQAMLALRTVARRRLELPGLTASVVEIPLKTSKFDLTLDLEVSEERIAGGLEYSGDLFDPPTVLRLIGHLEALLQAVLADGECPLWALPLLAPTERQQLFEWGGAGLRGDPPARETLAELFEARVRQSPDAPAVSFGRTVLTYDELNRRANWLANRLRELGIGPEDRVGLCVERSLELVVGVVGIAKSGGAYVPLDPGYPRERRAFLVQDCGARVVVGTVNALADLPHPGPVLLLDEGAGELERCSETDPLPLAGAESLAYVIYTSGSTGRPKGVLVPHGNVVHLFQATWPWFGFGAEDVWTLFHSYAFDFSVWEMWGALLHGGRLVVVPYAVSRIPEELHDLLARERVTVLNQTPSAFAQLMRVDGDPARQGSLPDLRLVIFGGEALEPWRLAPWFERHGDQWPRLVNMYGITETTVHVTYRALRAEDARIGPVSVIGASIPGLPAWVLDPWLGLAPIGVPGELAIGGRGLARGYLGRPDLTAERFLPDPLSGEPGARLYRSGDLGRFLPTGELEHRGRIDHQVKIRGFRIELEEIQLALAEHPGVQEAIVLAREDADERRLIAYVVPQPGQSLQVAELRARLAGKLPEYMVPAAFVLLAAFPLTENGKVDRKALLALAMSRREDAVAFTPPTNEIEGALAEIWEQVLGVDRAGIDDRFFSLGGDSILSLRVRTLAEERGLHFSLQSLLEHPTVRELARHLEPGPELLGVASEPFGLLTSADRAALPPGLEDAYPLAALQTGMLYHSVYTEDSALYHNVSSFRFSGRLDGGALHASVAELLARHPVLRTSFDLSRFSEPLQLVHARVEPPLAVVDLRGIGAAEQERLLEQAFLAEKRERFDASRPPLLRFRIYRLDEELFQLLWTEHHAILDGWSVASMLAELFQLYGRRRHPHSELLPPPPGATFRDFVALERRTLEGEEGRRYWREQLDGVPRTSLPHWPGRELGSAPRMNALSSLLERDLVARLKRIARQAGVPLKSVLLAIHFRVLSQFVGQDDLVSGLVVHGRPEMPGGERVLGLFLNTLPLRLRLGGGSWLDLLRRAFTAERGLMPFRRYPLAKLQELTGGGALFGTAFNFVHFHVLDRLGSGEERVLGGQSFGQTSLPFTASFAVVAGGADVALQLEFDEALYSRQQVAGLADLYQRVGAALAADPEAPYNAVSLLRAAERQQLLAEWNDTAGCAVDLCLHEIFDLRAVERPESPAVVAPGRSLTYGELRREANRLAHRLRSRGVGPDVPVGVFLDRRPEVLIALLGILKAGGAYVPLSVEDPEKRLVRLIESSGTRLVVTLSDLGPRLGDVSRALLLDHDLEADTEMEGPASEVGPASLAYILYTSGSTGAPKGVMVSHRGVVNYLSWAIGAYGMGPGRRSLVHSALGFDLTVTALLGPLLAGGEVHLAPEGDATSAIVAALEAGPVELLKLTPAHLELLRREISASAASRVGALVVGGEALLGQALDFWRTVAPATQVVNEYGPTEMTVGCSFYSAPAAAIDSGPVSIGRPIANTQLHVLSAELDLLPPGARGELFLGGQGLARGYVGRPDLTAERFLPDPFGEAPGSRLYRSGDLVWRRPDGGLEFVGRMDAQIKVRGFRIEPGEIAAVLGLHPAVREVVVAVREERPADRRLVAYVVPREEAADLPFRLRLYAAERLPAYLVPAAFVLLPEFPLTAHGKVDRTALPAPTWAGAEAQVLPRTALEKVLAGIWRQVLVRDEVGVTDNFFLLGGHSLVATQLISRVRSIFQVEIPIRLLFEAPTIETFALALSAAEAKPGQSEKIARALLRLDARRAQVGPVQKPVLVEMETGSGRPFFLVHPIGGDVLCYIHLARQLGAERAVYGLQVPDRVASGAETTIEERAASYLLHLRMVQPSGPYSLAGWSMGGVLAFEMARQLELAGESVAFLGLLDTFAPGSSKGRRTSAIGGELVALFAQDLAPLSGIGLLTLPEGFGRLSVDEALGWLSAEVKQLDLLPPGLEGRYLEQSFRMFAAHYRALGRYVGGSYSSPLVLYRAAEPSAPTASDPTLGWQSLLGRPIEVHSVPGDHYSLLSRAHAEGLAALLLEQLDRVEATCP